MAFLPLVYSCSGCSGAAQLANFVALELDSHRRAEMSCIAGLGGDVESLVRLAKSGRPLVAIDGCPLQCVRRTLSRHALSPRVAIILSDYGVKKRRHGQIGDDEAQVVLARVREEIRQAFQPDWPEGRKTVGEA